MRLPDALNYQVGGPIQIHNSIDIRRFEGLTIINRHGKVVAVVRDGKLVRPKEELYINVQDLEQLSSLVQGDQPGR